MAPHGLSIAVRLRRVTTETAQVSVSITEELMCPNDQGDGKKLDVDKIIEAALRMGRLETADWQYDGEPEIQLHPVQNGTGHSGDQ